MINEFTAEAIDLNDQPPIRLNNLTNRPKVVRMKDEDG